jgi:hypothetical protein
VSRPLSRHEVQRDDRIVRSLGEIADSLAKIAWLLEKRLPDPIEEEGD